MSWQTFSAWRVSAVFTAALLALLLAALVALYAQPPRGTRVRSAWDFVVYPLTGPDKGLSWSKLITAFVLVLYGVGAAVPQGVAITAIAAAHGVKVLLALIDKMSLNIASADTLNVARSTTTSTTRATSDSTTTTNQNQMSKTVVEILARRDAGDGTEAAP